MDMDFDIELPGTGEEGRSGYSRLVETIAARLRSLSPEALAALTLSMVLAIGAADFLVGGATLHAQHFVGVFSHMELPIPALLPVER